MLIKLSLQRLQQTAKHERPSTGHRERQEQENLTLSLNIN